MPALNFQKQFAPLVESGKKRQTIRAYRKDGRDPKVGDKLYLFTGQRTKWSRRLVVQRGVEVIRRAIKGLPLGHVVECRSAESVTLLWSSIRYGDAKSAIWTRGGGLLGQHHGRELARADGFVDWDDMLRWFEKTHGLPFKGLLIRW